MKVFQKIAGAFFIILAVMGGSSFADYQFDDLIGPNGVSYQWMVVNDVGDTFGDSHAVAMDVSGDVVSDGDAIIHVLNGKSSSQITSRNLHTLFLVVADGYGELDMNFRSPTMYMDVATPNLLLSNILDAEGTPYVYVDTKTALGHPGGNYDGLWRSFHFAIGRQNRDTATRDTVAQYFYFQQAPSATPSQGIMRPMVIASVGNGTAEEYPLKLRMTLRDSSGMDGNIVAHDVGNWSVTGPKTLGDNHWVFVPVVDLVNINNSRINYYLTTEIANYSALRYAALPYDSYGSWQFPNYWKFDFPRMQGTTYIENEFQLAPLSHIAPGLVTVYRRQYNVNETNKRPLRLFPVDNISDTGTYDLILNHNVIYGKRLGETYKESATEGRFSLFEVTAYQPRPATLDFYDRVASVMKSSKTVEAPSYSMFNASAINRNLMPSEAINYFTVNQTIPSSLRSDTKEGILPLHITFNIPVTLVRDRNFWNELMKLWRTNSDITEEFSNVYHIYAMVDTDGTPNPWDLTQELQDKGYYSNLVKVFFDEDRGRVTQDNDRGLITISFMAMLMDGTRDSRGLPSLQIVPDHATNSENDYIIMRDGNLDNKWNMTFFIAPSEYINNPVNPNNNNNNNNNENVVRSSSSGGGGCNSGLIFAAVGLLFFFRKGEK